MPIPPVQTAPFDTLETVLNTARVRMNDAIQSLGGDVLRDDQPFTQQMANTAWRRLQEYIANLGYTVLTDEIIITGLPQVDSIDPGTQTALDWTGYQNAQGGIDVDFALPQNFMAPLKVWERITGQNAYFRPLGNVMDGLPSTPKMGYNGIFEWRGNKVWMPGSQNSMDLRFRFIAFFNDFVTQGDVLWNQQPVPIMRCLDALSFYICSEAANPRGDLDGAQFDTKAQAAAKLIFNRDVRLKTRTNVRRRPRSGGSGHGSGACGGGMYGSGY